MVCLPFIFPPSELEIRAAGTMSLYQKDRISYHRCMSLTLSDRARRVKVLLFDVDGVLTNGDITIIPNAEGKGTEVKSFSAHDGLGISLARLAGLKIGFVTKRNSQVVAIRARDLKIDHVYQGQNNKMEAVNQILAAESCTLEELAYVGDDIIDLPVMRVVGLAIATANARPQVKAVAHYVTPLAGGFGAGRDAIDFILSERGVLESTIEEYLDPTSAESRRADIGQGNM
jgi:3-deoxy-D-manno-octulosonate 8-phosphate phosphatase (KDO 8-P phosphatase)